MQGPGRCNRCVEAAPCAWHHVVMVHLGLPGQTRHHHIFSKGLLIALPFRMREM
jgi:hypothetical protein